MEERIPRHVSIIMDGNGRWAKARGKERVQGHIEGVESVRACVEAAAEDGVEFLSLYAFSEENWNRPAEEVSALMDLMMLSIRREVGSFVKNGIRCIVLGNRSRLSEKARSAIEGMERETAGGRRMTLVSPGGPKGGGRPSGRPGGADTGRIFLLSGHRRNSGSGPADPDVWGTADFQLSALAVRLYRVPFYRRFVAGFPEGGVPFRPSGVRKAGPAVRKSEIKELSLQDNA